MREIPMRLTGLSLYYLAGYLTIGGVALLLAPKETLRFLLSNGDYGDIFPRLAGMFASGLGLCIFGIARARAHALYLNALAVRAYFIVSLLAFYWMNQDPLFLVTLGIVLFGVILTSAAYLHDRRPASTQQ